MSWYLILYIILCIAFTAFLTNKLNPTGSGRATLVAIGATLLFIFFGVRWFSLTPMSKSWPPTINMCPDYLTFIPSITGSTSTNGGGCVDLLGMTSSASGLQTVSQSDIAGISHTDTTKLFEYTADDVSATQGDSIALQNICTRCMNAGITWEGVYDGDTCLALNRGAMDKALSAQCKESA